MSVIRRSSYSKMRASLSSAAGDYADMNPDMPYDAALREFLAIAEQEFRDGVIEAQQ